MRSRHRALRLPLALVAVVTSFIGLGVFSGSAHAIIGRPLTPMSYAGVARRTTRRMAYTGAAMGGYGYGYGYTHPPVVVAPAPVMAPPVVAPAPAYYW